MNEIPISLFIGMGVFLIIFILYTLVKHALVTSLLSSILAYVMAQSILNGNVVTVAIINSVYTNTPVRSLPIHYLLLGIAAIMTILTFYIIVMVLNERIESIDGTNEQRRLED